MTISPAAAKALRRLSKPDRARIVGAIGKLPAGDVKILTGYPLWRLRVGDWRVLFEVDFTAKAIQVADVRLRGDAYRHLGG